jgi:hypothetical protein
MMTLPRAFGCFAIPNLTGLLSLENYWYAFVSAVLGATLGIAWTIGHFRRERRQARRNCLTRLRACLEFNLDRLSQAKGQLAQGIVPSYPLDTAQMNHWITEAYDFVSEDLLHHLDWQRFQLDHITSKFIVANTVVVTTAGGTSMPPAQAAYYNALAQSLATHVDIVLRELPPLLEQLPKTV